MSGAIKEGFSVEVIFGAKLKERGGRFRDMGSEHNREKEANILWVTWKTNKALIQDLYRSRRHRTSSREGLESLGGKVSSAGFHAPKNWPWRMRRNLNFPGFGTKNVR